MRTIFVCIGGADDAITVVDAVVELVSVEAEFLRDGWGCVDRQVGLTRANLETLIHLLPQYNA